jgi:hypothetical protein
MSRISGLGHEIAQLFGHADGGGGRRAHAGIIVSLGLYIFRLHAKGGG